MSIDLNIADFFKLPVKIFAAIAIGAGLILFFPDPVIEKLYLTEFRDSFGFIIGLIFIVSISVVGVAIIIACYSLLSNKLLFNKTKKTREKHINNLDDYQKAIVYTLFEEINHTGELPINDGSVRWLEQNMIIGKATNQHFISNLENPEFPYMFQPWAIEYLKEHKDLLDKMKKATSQLMSTIQSKTKENWYYL